MARRKCMWHVSSFLDFWANMWHMHTCMWRIFGSVRALHQKLWHIHYYMWHIFSISVFGQICGTCIHACGAYLTLFRLYIKTVALALLHVAHLGMFLLKTGFDTKIDQVKPQIKVPNFTTTHFKYNHT